MNIDEWSFGKRIYMNIIFSKCRVAFSSNFLFQKDCVALTVWETISGNFFWFLPETAFHPLWITVDSFVMQMRRAHRETAAKHSLLAFSVSLFHSSLLILIFFCLFLSDSFLSFNFLPVFEACNRLTNASTRELSKETPKPSQIAVLALYPKNTWSNAVDDADVFFVNESRATYDRSRRATFYFHFSSMKNLHSRGPKSGNCNISSKENNLNKVRFPWRIFLRG